MDSSPRAIKVLTAAMEGLVLVTTAASPWAFGSVDVQFEFLIYVAITGLLGLWATSILVARRLHWNSCPVMVCLAGVFLLGVVQLTPLPKSILASFAPGTADMHDRLLPAQPEVLAVDAGQIFTPLPARTTISLYPAVTRKSLFPLLAAIILFGAVRFHIASPDSLHRLSIVALVNGALLSLFGLIQFFGSVDRSTLYWSFPSAGSAFGPFVNRNHFAFYVNICIGLALGLLLVRVRGTMSSAVPVSVVDAGRWRERVRGLLGDPAILLQLPTVVWRRSEIRNYNGRFWRQRCITLCSREIYARCCQNPTRDSLLPWSISLNAILARSTCNGRCCWHPPIRNSGTCVVCRNGQTVIVNRLAGIGDDPWNCRIDSSRTSSIGVLLGCSPRSSWSRFSRINRTDCWQQPTISIRNRHRPTLDSGSSVRRWHCSRPERLRGMPGTGMSRQCCTHDWNRRRKHWPHFEWRSNLIRGKPNGDSSSLDSRTSSNVTPSRDSKCG